ncbi:VARLMGL domain-containing protein, variant 2 [Balamuthia mandrillaris]
MAPEVAMGEKYDKSADVFSFAMVLYEIIARQYPPERTILKGLFAFHPDEAKEAIPIDTPPGLWDVLCRCAATDGKDRPTFEEVVEDLKKIQKAMSASSSSAPAKPAATTVTQDKGSASSASSSAGAESGEPPKKKSSASASSKRKKKDSTQKKKTTTTTSSKAKTPRSAEADKAQTTEERERQRKERLKAQAKERLQERLAEKQKEAASNHNAEVSPSPQVKATDEGKGRRSATTTPRRSGSTTPTSEPAPPASTKSAKKRADGKSPAKSGDNTSKDPTGKEKITPVVPADSNNKAEKNGNKKETTPPSASASGGWNAAKPSLKTSSSTTAEKTNAAEAAVEKKKNKDAAAAAAQEVSQHHYLFYKGQASCPHPDYANDTIDTVHKKWFLNYDLLEKDESYIHWLFPTFKNISPSAAAVSSFQPLCKAEAKLIRDDLDCAVRVLHSYKLLLNFFGMVLDDAATGKLRRHPDAAHWRARYAVFNQNSEANTTRVCSMLVSLGEMGFRKYKMPFALHVKEEIEKHGELKNCKKNLARHWIGLVTKETDAEYEKKTKETREDRENSVFFKEMERNGSTWRKIVQEEKEWERLIEELRSREIGSSSDSQMSHSGKESKTRSPVPQLASGESNEKLTNGAASSALGKQKNPKHSSEAAESNGKKESKKESSTASSKKTNAPSSKSSSNNRASRKPQKTSEDTSSSSSSASASSSSASKKTEEKESSSKKSKESKDNKVEKHSSRSSGRKEKSDKDKKEKTRKKE